MYRIMPVAGLPGCWPVVPLLISKAPVELKVESSVAVKAPVTATVPVTPSDVPLQVKFALSLNNPEAPANVTLVLVSAVFLILLAVRNVPSQVSPDAPPNTPLLLN